MPITPSFIADCGHVIPELPDGHCGGTGYGVDANGKKSCYECCAKEEREFMIANGSTTLYLTKRDNGMWNITDWAGKLSFNVREIRTSRYGGGFGSQRTDAWFIGPDMHIWHAINRGDMQIARCRRTVRKWTQMAHGGYGETR
jgi:hypothetical protein